VPVQVSFELSFPLTSYTCSRSVPQMTDWLLFFSYLEVHYNTWKICESPHNCYGPELNDIQWKICTDWEICSEPEVTLINLKELSTGLNISLWHQPDSKWQLITSEVMSVTIQMINAYSSWKVRHECLVCSLTGKTEH